jgi:hypothetical protein
LFTGRKKSLKTFYALQRRCRGVHSRGHFETRTKHEVGTMVIIFTQNAAFSEALMIQQYYIKQCRREESFGSSEKGITSTGGVSA